MKSRLAPARLSLVLLLWTAHASRAQTLLPDAQVLASYPWVDTANAVPPDWSPRRQLVDPSTGTGGKMLKVSNPGPLPLQVAILTVPKPPITADYFALRCQVRYEDVSGDGYLEMWTTFPGGGSFFTRTVDENPGSVVAKLSGTSDWRPLFLPFTITPHESPRPEQLSVNVILPGHGTVYLTEMQLIQVRPMLTDGVSASGQPTPSRSEGNQVPPPPTGRVPAGRGTAGPRLPAAYVIMGGLMTAAMILLGVMARRQRYRALVLAGAWTLTALAAAMFLASIFEVWKSRMPPSEWALRMVLGVFVCGMFAACAWSFQRRYQRAEWRRMAAMDI